MHDLLKRIPQSYKHDWNDIKDVDSTYDNHTRNELDHKYALSIMRIPKSYNMIEMILRMLIQYMWGKGTTHTPTYIYLCMDVWMDGCMEGWMSRCITLSLNYPIICQSQENLHLFNLLHHNGKNNSKIFWTSSRYPMYLIKI